MKIFNKFLGNSGRDPIKRDSDPSRDVASALQRDDKPINWAPIYEAHKGKWVALEDDEQTVIASGETAKEALSESRKKGFENPILALMPDSLTPYIG